MIKTIITCNNDNHPKYQDGTFAKKPENDKKIHRVSTMITSEEHEQLRYFSKNKNLTYSEIIRKALSVQLYKFRGTIKKRKKPIKKRKKPDYKYL